MEEGSDDYKHSFSITERSDVDLIAIVTTLLAVALVGFLVWMLITYIPMPDPFKQVIIVICVILLILYILALLTGNATPIRLRL